MCSCAYTLVFVYVFALGVLRTSISEVFHRIGAWANDDIVLRCCIFPILSKHRYFTYLENVLIKSNVAII